MQLTIPIDILRLILDEVVSLDDLGRIRTASKTLCALSTPAAFRRVGVTNTEERARGFAELLRREDIAPHIREVVYVDAAVHETSWDEDPDGVSAGRHDAPVREALGEAFALLHTLPKIHTLSLTFHPCWDHASMKPYEWVAEDQIDCDRFLLQIAALQPIFTASLPLRSLTLDNLITCHHSIYEQPGFRDVISKLTDLRITTVSNAFNPFPPEFDFEEPPPDGFWFEFWSRSIQDSFLSNPALLTSFILVDDYPHHSGPRPIDFSGLTFPALKQLCVVGVRMSSSEFVSRHEHLEQWTNRSMFWEREIGWRRWMKQDGPDLKY